MGFAIAQVAAELGAEVTLIAGPVDLVTPFNVKRYDVESAEQMLVAVKTHYGAQDVFISAAAIADFRAAHPAEQKLKKQVGQTNMILELVKTPDIVAWVAQQTNKPLVVGFAAETQNVVEYARDKLLRKGLDLICANQVGLTPSGKLLGFNQDNNALTLITAKSLKPLVPSSKQQQAFELFSYVAETFKSL